MRAETPPTGRGRAEPLSRAPRIAVAAESASPQPSPLEPIQPKAKKPRPVWALPPRAVMLHESSRLFWRIKRTVHYRVFV